MLELYGLKIKTSGSVYEPAEDTFLLISALEKLGLKGKRVLEIGTGSGIIALFAARNAKSVTAVDINPEAVKCAKENAARNKIKNIEFMQSDLFANIKGILRHGVLKSLERSERILRNEESWHCRAKLLGTNVPKSSKALNASERKFDIIVFNPPYLPDEPTTQDIALDGGPDGRRVIEKFLKGAPKFLNPRGKILLLESSLSHYEKTIAHFKKMGLSAEIAASQKFNWEKLVVIEVTHI